MGLRTVKMWVLTERVPGLSEGNLYVSSSFYHEHRGSETLPLLGLKLFVVDHLCLLN